MKESLIKFEKLKEWLVDTCGVVIAFSGGVDSSFLSYTASCVKDIIKVILVTAKSETYDPISCEEAKTIANGLKLKHILIDTSELDIPGFKNNDKNRCYYCKYELFSKLKKIAEEKGISVVCDATTKSDENDYRPGFKARDELGIKSPLQEIGFYKEEIRKLSEYFNLPDPYRPATVCYASRFPYGEEITKEKINKVSQCETFLKNIFHNKNIRVRYHKEVARIEIDSDVIDKILDNRDLIIPVFKRSGFRFITLDLEGYRQGSFNFPTH
ncbi:MAG: ATP-dependent sacrificial sulfur transferase LarE [Candidatus Hydrogenedentota bacterium]